MIGVRQALATVLSEVPRVGSEQIGLTAAHRRVLAEPVLASRDVPPFRNSAMDGFAVRSDDVRDASPSSPVRLRVVEVIGAGRVAQRTVEPGTAIKIMTGSSLPAGADAVVRVEDTEENTAEISVHNAVAPGAEVREAGEDIRAGDTVLNRGRVLRPPDIGLLASLGFAVVRVARRPRVAIISTGDELVELGQALGPGQIVNSNAYTLTAAVEEIGGEPIMLGIARDEPERIRAAFEEAFSADLVLSTGGVSVGSFDFVRRTLADLGYQERFWKVAQKPGKPLSFGLCGGTPAFGLPGNPVSSLVCFYVYVAPVLRTMMGMERVHLPSVEATVGAEIRTAEGLTEFVRCVVEREGSSYRVRPTGSQSSGVLRSLSLGEALLVAPAELKVIPPGTCVRVILLGGEGAAADPPF